MTELKTLKDFGSKGIQTCMYCDLNGLCESCEEKNDLLNKLKAEAIKWVKELRRTTGTTGKIDYRLSFKHFFNITEEDLK